MEELNLTRNKRIDTATPFQPKYGLIYIFSYIILFTYILQKGLVKVNLKQIGLMGTVNWPLE